MTNSFLFALFRPAEKHLPPTSSKTKRSQIADADEQAVVNITGGGRKKKGDNDGKKSPKDEEKKGHNDGKKSPKDEEKKGKKTGMHRRMKITRRKKRKERKITMVRREKSKEGNMMWMKMKMMKRKRR